MSESPEDTPGFDLGEPAPVAPAQAYRVLARKYRPQKFSELIGQEAMVQTLANAIRRDRLAHAFLMTGVRGVGKTSTARLIAKALNCIGPDGQGGPTIDPCDVCEPCRAIAEGRHIDVIEMDAASHTGVDDVREIIEAVRYAAVSARYKIYIIDEVHMLSRNAFNALLKTLEEPPPHVKFLFATTEVQKMPVTVLSRCQRFDLRRIPAAELARHFARIARAEGIEAEGEALALIARAAEGSARDGLSILDQAIAHADGGEGRVTAAMVRAMLGLSDKGAVRELFGKMLSGDAAGVLAAAVEQHELGVDPLSVMRSLLEIAHGVTVTKAGAPPDAARSAEEQQDYDRWAGQLSYALLHRLWQLLLKGHDEVGQAQDPQQAVEMALLRVVHAGQLPDPGELARRIAQGGGLTPAVAAAAGSPASPAAAEPPAHADAAPDFPRLVEKLADSGFQRLSLALHDQTGLMSCGPGLLKLRPLKPLDGDFARELTSALKASTGMAWRVELAEGAAAPSLREQQDAAEAQAREAVLAVPLVRATMEAFPEAELLDHGQSQGGA